MMDVLRAAHLTAHEFDNNSGCESLAPKMGLTPAVLRNKVNPNNDKNHLRLDEAMLMMEVTGSHAIMQSAAARLGGVYVKLPDAPECSQEERCIETLGDLVMCAMTAQGEACAEFMIRKQNGVICINDRKALREKGQKVIEEMQKFMELIKD